MLRPISAAEGGFPGRTGAAGTRAAGVRKGRAAAAPPPRGLSFRLRVYRNPDAAPGPRCPVSLPLPPARRGARGSVRLRFRRGWARRRFRPWGGFGDGVTTGRPAPAQAPPFHACAGRGGGAARSPAAARSTPPPTARGGIRFRTGVGAERAGATHTPQPGHSGPGPGGGARSGRRERAAGSAPSPPALRAGERRDGGRQRGTLWGEGPWGHVGLEPPRPRSGVR